MLPRALSEDRLSLVEGQDRLCLGCELRIDADGVVTAVDVFEGVMRSRARLDYDAVATFLDQGAEGAVVDDVKPTLRRLRTAAARLSVQRAARGGVAVDRGEARLHFDADGRPVGVSEATTTSAHLLIERLMVAANEGVARWCHDRGVPTLYRVHDAPDLERTASLVDAAAALVVPRFTSRRRPSRARYASVRRGVAMRSVPHACLRTPPFVLRFHRQPGGARA
jgi:ribonuclease R